MSARDAFKECLRLAIVFGNTAAYRAGATYILRRHRMNVAAQSLRLPIKFGDFERLTFAEAIILGNV